MSTTRQLKIAMLLDNPFRPDQRVLREAESLSRAGYKVTVFAWDRDREVTRPLHETLHHGIRIIRIPVKTGQQLGIRQIPRFIVYVFKVIQLVLKGDFDIIHCHDLLNLPVGVLIKFLKGIPVVYDAHEIYWMMEAKKYPRIFLSIIKYGEVILINFVDAFITVGKTRVEYYRKQTKKPIFLVGNWYDPQEIDELTGAAVRQRLGIPHGAFVVLYAGTLSPVRASDVLIDSIKQMDSNPNVHWIICGRGPSETLFLQAESSRSNLHYLSWVENLAPYFSASNALIYLMDPAHPYTPFNAPNNLYLSIAWRLPLIGVAAGEIGATLTSEQTGLLLENVTAQSILNAVCRLATQREMYNSIVIGLEELQENYSWKSANRNLFSAYRHLLAGSKKRSININ